MSWKFSVVSTLLSLALASNMLSQSYAQISYHGTSFESIATAETEAGEEYSYIINNAEPVGLDGTYSFDELGTAPGYYSSAKVGIAHETTLTSTVLHLTDKAYGYVSDDAGSQVLRHINGSGGDVYEGSTASYDVTLTAR